MKNFLKIHEAKKSDEIEWAIEIWKNNSLSPEWLDLTSPSIWRWHQECYKNNPIAIKS